MRKIINQIAASTGARPRPGAETTIRSQRYERKAVVEYSDRHAVEALIRRHPGRFQTVHSPAVINNIYWDTPLFRNYRDAVDGVASRLKVRIRWYGDFFPASVSPQLEIKGKDGHVFSKTVYPLARARFFRGMNAEDMAALVRTGDLPGEISRLIGRMRPVLVNRYQRQYYRTGDGRYRLTLDYNLCFSGVRPFDNQYNNWTLDDSMVIVEFKYDPTADDRFFEIANEFPFRISGSSKYVIGMSRVYGLGR